jgi:hypothetical protein
MQGISGVFMALALFWLLSGSAAAATTLDDNDHAPKKFSMNATDPSSPDQSSTPSASNNQTPGSIPRATVHPVPLNGREKFRFYLRSTYGPASFAYTFAGSWINQTRDMVPEWGQGMEGYGKRFGSSYGQKVVKNSIRLGLVDLMQEDPRYFASSRSGIWSRTEYAIGQAFISHKDSGGIRVGYSKFISSFAASYVAHQWYPDTYHTAGDYLTGGALSIAIDAGKNVWSEFWPDIRRKVLHH